MRNILAIVGAAVVLFVGLGWYLDWYKVSAKPSTDGRTSVQVDINGKKIIKDGRNAAEQTGEFLKGLSKTEGKDAEKAATPASLPGPNLSPVLTTTGKAAPALPSDPFYKGAPR